MNDKTVITVGFLILLLIFGVGAYVGVVMALQGL